MTKIYSILNVCVHVALPKDKFIHTHHNLNQQELSCGALSQWISTVSEGKISQKGTAHPAANGQKPTTGNVITLYSWLRYNNVHTGLDLSVQNSIM